MVQLSQAWTKAIAFEVPSSTIMDDKDIHGEKDAVGIMCTVYASYRNCLKACVAGSGDGMNAGALDVSPPYSQVCTDKLNDNFTWSSCLTNNTKTYHDLCKNENEQALAAAVRLTSGQTLDQSNMNSFCKAANSQLYCLLPLVRQTCTEQPYDLIRSIANASLISVRFSIGEKAIREQYPECETYLQTVDIGIPMDVSSSPEATTGTTNILNTTTVMSTSSNQTAAINSTIGNTTSIGTTTAVIGNETTTTAPIRRDDAGGQDDTQGRFGGTGAPRYQSTTESSAVKPRLNFMSMITFALVFAIFS
jgi:hypothetical protein